MSFSLSNLLNPAPTGDSDAIDSQGDGHVLQQTVPNPQDDSGLTGSPVAAQHQPVEVAAMRRPSLFGEDGKQLPQANATPFQITTPSLEQYGFPSKSPEMRRTSKDDHVTIPGSYAAQSSRKMSSPSLERYHVTSHSPEQRRSSPIGEPGYTLAPLQNYNTVASQGQEAAVKKQPDEHVTSQSVLVTNHTEKPQAEDITQPRGSEASVNPEHDIKMEPSMHSSIPAFVPVPSIKREQSAQIQELRESSIPFPTTEEMPTEEIRGKKRPAPKTTTKKGTAKKGPPSKKRKTEQSGSATPSLHKSKPAAVGRGNNIKKATSAAGTPLNSSPAPRSVRTASSAEPDTAFSGGEEDDEEDEPGTPGPDDEVYCICRRPDTGTFMIGCDGGCDDWFHGKCVGIEEKNKNLIDRYMCPNCEDKGKGVTTWKRMCRREGCRMPARVGKKKGETPSKYCSEECGVLFFKTLVENTRGPSETSSQRKASRKKSSAGNDVGGQMNDDLGPRGGILSAGEVKALVTSVPDIDHFKRLGDGVLSPPATPSPHDSKVEPEEPKLDSVLNDAEKERTATISKGKDESRARHALLKDRTKFITMLKQAASRIATENNMKPKEMCGYDPRVSWSEERFDLWRQTQVGAEALATGTLQKDSKDSQGDVDMVDGIANDDEVNEVCTKRKCARHYDWSKLALDDTRFELGENSERMRRLERDEQDVRERAGLRVREHKAGGGGGNVIIHDVNAHITPATAEVTEIAEAEPTSTNTEEHEETSSGVDQLVKHELQTEAADDDAVMTDAMHLPAEDNAVV